MFNATNLNHPTTRAKIFAAMKRATQSSLAGGGGQQYILNAQGKPYMRVKHTRGHGGGFTFATNKLICDDVKKVLRAA